MPELPEVETTMRGIKPHIVGQCIHKIIVRCARLRWPIPKHIEKSVKNREIKKITRRHKYLLITTDAGTMIWHLGMSGRFTILPKPQPAAPHDHIDILLANDITLRYTDPRRFGCLLWTSGDPLQHPLLLNLGPEPLTKTFSGKYLWEISRRKNTAIKAAIMDNRIVAGVGNIYATEALFIAGIHPKTPAKLLTLKECAALVTAIKVILKKAINKGGTTLKDFLHSNGKPGYFRINLQAYGRAGAPCLLCKKPLKSCQISQRSSIFCDHCQPLRK